MVALLNQVEGGGRHRTAAVPAEMHGGQVGGLGADVQPQHLGIAAHRPDVVDNEVFVPLARGADRKWGSVRGRQGWIVANRLFVGGLVLARHALREGQIAHAGIAPRCVQFCHHPIKVSAPQRWIQGKKAVQAEHDLGVGCHALTQRVCERLGLLGKARLLDDSQRLTLLKHRPIADDEAHHRNGAARQPGAITAVR